MDPDHGDKLEKTSKRHSASPDQQKDGKMRQHYANPDNQEQVLKILRKRYFNPDHQYRNLENRGNLILSFVSRHIENLEKGILILALLEQKLGKLRERGILIPTSG